MTCIWILMLITILQLYTIAHFQSAVFPSNISLIYNLTNFFPDLFANFWKLHELHQVKNIDLFADEITWLVEIKIFPNKIEDYSD